MTSFSVNYRNPGHWDIYVENRRAFCIRGELGDVWLNDERPRAKGELDTYVKFKTLDAAMLHVVGELMFEMPEPL